MNDVTIIGAGLCGTLLALYLAKRGYTLNVYDARPDLRYIQADIGRSINLALSCRGLTSLAGVGIMSEIEELIVPMRARAIHDIQGQIKYQSFGRHHDEYINAIERSELNKLLLKVTEKYPKVRFHFNTKLSGLDVDKKILFFETANGDLISKNYQCLIGADGASSCVRDVLQAKKIIRATRNFLTYGYKELLIGGPGQNHLIHEHLHLWPRDAFLLLGNPNRDRSITGSLFLPHEGKNSFTELESEAKVHEFFKESFSDVYKTMPDLITEFSHHPTGNMSTIKCDPWYYQDHCMLIGDAAHGIVPFFGQGMNSAFEDCYVLNELLDKYYDDWAQVIPAFYQTRKMNTDAVAQMSMDNFYEIQTNICNPHFNLKKQLEQVLMQRYPNHYVSKHVLVMFTNTPYAKAQVYGDIQAEFLEMVCENAESIDDIDWIKVEKFLNFYDKKLAKLN
ncbi:MAG: NAD(P)/FAD-dependent oxidoreductase [Legionella sp.]|uniref:FAD-dependent oxidoreductase n=1 Tax=Legionella sp. TaxID=459 RepID=UPI0039E32CED